MTKPNPRPTPPWRYLLTVALTLVWLLAAAFTMAIATVTAFGFPGPLVSVVVAGVAGLVVGGFTLGFGVPDRAAAWRAARVGGWVFAATVGGVGLWSLLGVTGAVLVAVALAGTCPATWSKLLGLRRAGWRQSATPTPGAGGVFGPPTLRAAHEAELEAVQSVPAAAAPPVPVEPVGGIDMTAFEVALLHTEAAVASGLVAGLPGRADSVNGSELARLDVDELCTVWRRSSVLLRQDLDGPRLAMLLQTRQHVLDELLRRNPVGTRAWLAAVDRPGDDPRPFLAAEPGTA